ncbi:hypothetical protein PO883_16180 [Massilia sp. DJPM01]|uniref:hypothetical protein n=1 Tax=Massilia sp. DJPM01 TaxID=3024404 RepID=UPI00259DBDE9|nr:hypothetical protein [Massilia sp. DJPM01]MDM5178739.1 hypothetical protein [Massilia sp. DJPM01]
MQDASPDSLLSGNLATLLAFAVFFFVPMLFLVIGRDTGAFSRTWFLDPQECEAYWGVTKRGLVWFASAALAGTIVSLAASVLRML